MIEGIHKIRRTLADGQSRWYVYAFRGGPCIGHIDGAKFPRAIPGAMIKAYHDAMRERLEAPRESFAFWIDAYLNSPDWATNADSTKETWRLWVDRIKAKFGRAPLAVFGDPKMKADILEWRDEYAKTSLRNADYAIEVLRRILSFCVQRGKLPINIAAGMGTLYESDRSEIIWEAHERAAFIATRPIEHTWVLRLACLTGLRRSDLVALPWIADKGDHFRWLTQKSGKTVEVIIPIISETRALLTEIAADRPLHNGVVDLTAPILRNSHGRKWVKTSLTHVIEYGAQALLEAGIMEQQKRLHDCRGSFATELMLAGYTDTEAAEVLGWDTSRIKRIRRKYVDGKKIIHNAIARLDAARKAKEQFTSDL